MPTNKKKPSTASKAKSRSLKTGSSNKSKAKKQAPRKRSNSRRSPVRKKLFFRRSLIVPLLSLCLISFLVYLLVLDHRITQRFEGRIWQLPAHVYARPLELFVGKLISIKQLKFELEYLNYQKVKQLPQQAAQYRHWDNTFEIKTRDFIFWDGNEAAHSIRVTINNNAVTKLTDIYTGQNIDLVRFDAGYLTGIFPSHSEDRVLLRLDDVPDMFVKMLLLTEDRRFFMHWGVDPRSIARALAVNLSSGQHYRVVVP